MSLDSGCETNCIQEDECHKLNIKIEPLDCTDVNFPTQADGQSPLQIMGKSKFKAVRGKINFSWEGYVVKKLNAGILCGGSFLEDNNMIQDLKNKRVIVENKYYIMETSHLCPLAEPEPNVLNSIPHNTADEPTNKIEIGPSVPKNIVQELKAIHNKHAKVFDGDISEGYNGFSGDHEVDFNFVNNIPPPVNRGHIPSYSSREDQILLQAKIDQLESMGVVAKAHEIGIIPKFASPVMLVNKNSVREMGREEYNSLSIPEKLKHNRLVLCQNKLNEYVEKIPYIYTTVEDTIKSVGAQEFVITSDLTDSFWQRHIREDKKPYFAFHSPFRGTYIFLRSSQGFLNQSEGLENLVRIVLQKGIADGWVVVHADNIYVGGNTMDLATDRWDYVLCELDKNGLKLSPKKTACFPAALDLLGWSKQGRFLVPDEHRQNCLSKANLPTTAHDLRSYIGGYRCFFKAQEKMSQNLQDLEDFVAKTKTKQEKLIWTDELIKCFEDSKKNIKNLDKLYIPSPDDQLILTADWCQKGISATLWAYVQEKFLVVARTSCKLEKSQKSMLPCEGEASAQYVAAKCQNFRGYIKASKKRTISLTDSKPVYQAANLLKKGKFSSNKLINEILTSLSDLGLEYQHLSGKLGQNFIDDYGSRNALSCNSDPKCQICSFVRDCEQMTVGSILSFLPSTESIVASSNVRDKNNSNNLIDDIIKGNVTIPFNNRKAMKFLQDMDPNLIKLRSYLTTGKRPQVKNTKENVVKRYLQKPGLTIAKDGCLVVVKQNKLSKHELVIIPEELSMGLLYGMHINLNHPSYYQMSRMVDTRVVLF